MKLWEYTGEELIGGAEITSDVILAPEIDMLQPLRGGSPCPGLWPSRTRASGNIGRGLILAKEPGFKARHPLQLVQYLEEHSQDQVTPRAVVSLAVDIEEDDIGVGDDRPLDVPEEHGPVR
jgi:hypothetical protein